MQFIAGDAVLAIAEQPHGGKPLLKADRRILKDGPDLERELLLWMLAVAAIEVRLFKPGHLVGSAVGAANTPSGQRMNHELAAVLVSAKC